MVYLESIVNAPIHYLQVDSDERRQQSKIAANSKLMLSGADGKFSCRLGDGIQREKVIKP